jgi:cold shock CspA family protein
MPTGIVQVWFGAKGYGFITPDDGGEDVLAQVNCLGGGNYYLEKRDAVTFEQERNPRNNKMRCSTCSKTDGSDKPPDSRLGWSRMIEMREGCAADLIDGSFWTTFPGKVPEIVWVGPWERRD